jgi:feruloyl-CoA synthase
VGVRLAAIPLAPPDVVREDRPDGSFVLRSPHPLQPHERHLGETLRRWAERRPDAAFLAERAGGGEGWRSVTYAQALAAAESIGQALLVRGLGPERGVMVLSGNSVDHALLMLGCFLAGVPIAPVSPAYSLMSQDHDKLRRIVGLVRPGLVFVERSKPFVEALVRLHLRGVEVVTSDPEPPVLPATAFGELLETAPRQALRQAEARLGPDTVAKYLFTSGSTGLPKGVINTHGMLCANQQMLEQCWPFVRETPPVLVDWLPWNHTFGGNHNFDLVLRQGGTLYVDGGKPAPDLFEVTVRNLKEISPTIYFNVPVGFAMLLPRLEKDETLRRRFFERLQMIFYAGSALPQDLWERLEAVSVRARGERVLMTSAWGSTETAPLATSAHFPTERAGVIGIPVPGVEIKLVPSGPKLELRVRGPNVTPGYLRRPDLTRDAFDEEGFYKIGDAGRLADPTDPSRGLLFDGRVAEDFKLTTGTWVHVGTLRVRAIAAAAPALQDAVVCGQDREEVGLLAWPNLAACREICSDPGARDDPAALIRCAEVVQHIREGLRRHNEEHPGSSTRIGRVLLMPDPPSIDANEITDKGYVNQRACLERRADLVERLYAEPVDPDVLVV